MMMRNLRVGVARGGPSSEYEVSLKTGGEILRHLPEKYKGVDLLFDKKSNWHSWGYPKKPHQIFAPERGGVDIVFNALHGEFGEDGRAQQLFESFNIPYTGSQIAPSAFAMKKHLARDMFLRHGLKIPRGFVLKKDENEKWDAEYFAGRVFNSMPPLWVVKPGAAGSSVGVSICKSFSELVLGIGNAGKYGNVVLVEEFIKGVEATCGILEDFRGEREYTLPIIEIVPTKENFFGYDSKYSGSTREICPAGFERKVKREIENMAKEAHRALGCRHYSRADFIVSDRGVFLLEVNTLPGLTSESLFPKAASAAGLEFPALLDHIISLALNRH
ncbi:MAG: D-alanine--D-alanine ligase [Candidatus Pacebacteria bacterium]|nr:D-alanine--D-alanine ligase [Candidatus Paceibacterota bacterium]